MDTMFCSILATGEPIDGTAPEKDSAILIPAQKTVWHRRSAREILNEVSNNSEFHQTIASFKRPLVIFYAPNNYTRNEIFVCDSTGIQCFSKSGTKTERKLRYLYAVCTDGVKDACCAKFGLPVSQAFFEACEVDQHSLSLEVSHIGGCRFAATAICLPSGNSYGRILPDIALQIKSSEELNKINSKFFRGNIFVSEIHCWIMRHCMDNFGCVPSEEQTEVVNFGNSFQVTVKINQAQTFKFGLLQHDIELPLFSGCDNLDSGRSITRSIYDFVPAYA